MKWKTLVEELLTFNKMIGYIGVGLLLIAYVLLVSPLEKWFIPINMIASVILTIHAVMLVDIPFIIVNAFVSVLLFYKPIK